MTKERNNEITYDHANKTAIVNGWTYSLTALPQAERDALALLQLATWVGRQKEPQVAFKELCDGVRHVVRGPKAEKPPAPPKRNYLVEAVATVTAEHTLQEQKFKPERGVKLHDTAEFKALFDQAMQRCAGLPKNELVKYERRSDVRAMLVRIKGVVEPKLSLDALIAAPSAAVESHQADIEDAIAEEEANTDLAAAAE